MILTTEEEALLARAREIRAKRQLGPTTWALCDLVERLLTSAEAPVTVGTTDRAGSPEEGRREMKIDSEELEVLQCAADEVDGELRTDYSGRGMYGDSCVGLVVDGGAAALISFALHVADEDRELAEWLADHPPRTDSMGRSEIVYWPGLTVEGDD